MPETQSIAGALGWTTPEEFGGMIELCGPASILVVIESRMGGALLARMSPEDVYQDALVHAWRDRRSLRAFKEPSVRVFRAWLLTIIQHRICDLADREGAKKRGGDVRLHALDAKSPSSSGEDVQLFAALARSTTPSRVASYREQADAMRRALESLSEDVREIVRLRLFEQRPLEEIAGILGLGESAVRHRLRKGVDVFQRRLLNNIGTRRSAEASAAGAGAQDATALRGRNSSSSR